MVNITMLIISTIWFTLDLSVSVFRGHICYMLGSSSLTWVSRMCNCFAPIVLERRAYLTQSSHGVSARRTFIMVHTQGEHFLIISERSSYNATVNQSKIRCIKENITWNQYKWYDMAIIFLCLWSPSLEAPLWSPLSPARHLDLHRSIVVISPIFASTTIATA